MISKGLLFFLKICFWVGIAYLFIEAGLFLFQDAINYDDSESIFSIISIILFIPLLIIWVYSLIFLYKYDRYSKSIVYLLLFNFIYGLIYFYKVIWKRKRMLENTYKRESVIGNTVFMEMEDTEEGGDFEK